jgi:hypothetical protein
LVWAKRRPALAHAVIAPLIYYGPCIHKSNWSVVAWYMAKGWKIVTVLPNPGGAAPLQEWSLVAIADKSQAIRAIKARHPHAAIRVDSEADAELLAKYGVLDGKIFVLVEGT